MLQNTKQIVDYSHVRIHFAAKENMMFVLGGKNNEMGLFNWLYCIFCYDDVWL